MNTQHPIELGRSADARSAEAVGVHLVVAVKDLKSAKTRLATSFGPEDRVRLVLAMLADTLDAALGAGFLTDITVVTPDPEVGELAKIRGAQTLYDTFALRNDIDGVERLNSALTSAAVHVRAADPHGVVVALQADLPALRSREFSEAYELAGANGRSVVFDHHGTGTAALILTDPTSALMPMFGPDSARRHVDSGAVPLGGAWPGLRLDVDTHQDLEAAVAIGVGRTTRMLLDELGHVDRPGSAVR